ncbi:THAP domain-containing protein 5-like [Salarias fasciatus]|uniref:THAP domain-containing protein 5-like n=1 Tax=Salarias fasciatus TaxID=181472 RepID=A0A672IJJ0_SALFA|nr:THAP domain-containing protein 5-like [Salarias fasciatus]
MPKYCSVPNCKNDSGSGIERRSFYRFPLQDPVRLQQWLKNMGRENWTPSRHQYVCSEHFAPSCFRVRWGIHYIEKNAVPTLFRDAEKRKATDCSEQNPKRHRNDQSATASDDGTTASDAVDTQSALHTLHLYNAAVECGDVGECDSSLQTDADALLSGAEPEAGLHVPLALFQREEELSNGEEDTGVVLMSQCPAGDGQDELVGAVTAAILTQGHRLVFSDPADEAVGGLEEVSYASLGELSEETQVIAYYEATPAVFPPAAAQFTLCPETVLSSALSSKPITSTLPIVSKHVAPSPASLVLTVERVEDGDGDKSDEEDDDAEQQDPQLEEHCYHKNSLSKEQLEAVVTELQKKVKVLQQRHRRHVEKLAGLENTVSQLRQSNLLNEERLQLLERAYLQTSTTLPDGGETVAIIYEEDDAAYLYTPLNHIEA